MICSQDEEYSFSSRKLVECRQAPSGVYNGGMTTNFQNLPFGQDYYVIVQDGCYRDSAFFKDKTSAGGSELNPFAWHCNSFDIHADGNNYDTVCLWNAATNSLVSCKKWNDTAINPRTGLPWPSGGAEWYGLPYGEYYAYIYDPCEDTLVRIDSTIRYPRSFSTSLNYTCMVTQAAIISLFGPEAPRPHKTEIFYPNGQLAATYTDAGTYLTYPTWPQPGTITIIQEDGCGYRDTSLQVQPMILPVRSITFRGGCPGTAGNSGGGDIILTGNATAYGMQNNGIPSSSVTIIKKDNQLVNIPHNAAQWLAASQQWMFTISNLQTGTYILESSLGCAGYKVYDTIEIKPYVYPIQDQTHITQCGTNSFAFKDSVTGGIAPFTYEILNTVPYLSSLITGPQQSGIFMIPPGSSLDTVQLRVIDACGNGHVKSFPVSHLASCLPLEVVINPDRDHTEEKTIRVYPNPATKQFTIAFSQKRKAELLVIPGASSDSNVFRSSVDRSRRPEALHDQMLASRRELKEEDEEDAEM
ncbi:MAG: hypothetical protein EOP49_12565 [Sphingobacteriales bacterium]|nr:MAG: hypothetical protein EOP49_12565 [Sphingobacteriales bacterium]